MTRDELIGTWRCIENDTILLLRADGNCILRLYGSEAPEDQQRATWEHLDNTHWNLKFVYPPDPSKEWLVNGAVEVVTYTIESEAPDRMSLSQFDDENQYNWVKQSTGEAE